MNARQVRLLSEARAVFIAVPAEFRSVQIGNRVWTKRFWLEGRAIESKRHKGAQSE
jgi:hypothetical protein